MALLKLNCCQFFSISMTRWVTCKISLKMRYFNYTDFWNWRKKNIWIIVMYFFQMIIIIRCGNHHVSIFSWQFSVALLIYFSSFIIISITCCQSLCYYHYHFNFESDFEVWWALIREKEIQFSVQQFWQKKSQNIEQIDSSKWYVHIFYRKY